MKAGGVLQEIGLEALCTRISALEATSLLSLSFNGPSAKVWFDAGLVSFTREGAALFAPRLSSTALTALCDRKVLGIANLAAPHDVNLREHRARHGFLAENGPATQQ